MFLPLLASIFVVFGAPYVGEIRARLQSTFPEYYRSIIGGIVTIAVIAAIIAATAAIRRRQPHLPASAAPGRQRTWVRYASIALALGIAVLYARAVSSSNADVRVVEAFHFVEYGVITYLYYRVWRGRRDIGSVVFPACAALLVGIADEFVQWFVPGRVGELHDVLINAVAIGCALLFSTAVHPPRSFRLPPEPRSRLPLGATVAVLIVVAAAFIDRVHLAYEISDGQTLIFRSQYDARGLAAASAERAIRWRTSAPPEKGFAREDHYLTEGRWHIQHRNTKESEGNTWVAWNENRILERFYAPVLERGSRWSGEHVSRIAEAAHATERHDLYVSDAQESYPLYVIRRLTYWLVTAVIAAAVVLLFRGRAGREGRHR